MIAGNWKMNTNINEAVDLVREICADTTLIALRNVEKVICPPFISLAAVNEVIKDGSIRLGAQNIHFVPKGAYTGEISPSMLVGLCKYVIIGHSERRQYFNETSDVVNKKVKAVLDVKIKAILCVGEKLEDNEDGKTEYVLAKQLRSSLAGITSLDNLTIAYEPIWAIGTGRAATGQQANDTIGFIRRCLTDMYGEKAAQRTRILYGGSVNEDNAVDIMHHREIDGALVGGASLKASQFLNIIKHTSEIKGWI
jgi:triosephosphate isomerase